MDTRGGITIGCPAKPRELADLNPQILVTDGIGGSPCGGDNGTSAIRGIRFHGNDSTGHIDRVICHP